MAKDRVKYKRAMEHWQELHRQERYSEPSRYGKLAVIASFCWDAEENYDDEDIQEYAAEAQNIVQIARGYGKPAEAFMDATGATIADVLADPSYSDIITIGHGTLSMLYIDTGERNKIAATKHGVTYTKVPNTPYDWYDVARATKHLKLGTFVQRQCGGLDRDLAIPMGLFAVSSHANVYAAVNQTFEPSDLYDEANNALQPVCSVDQLGLREARELFSYASLAKAKS